MGRVRSTSAGAARVALSAVATGILVFLFWDVVSHGVEPVETHLEAHDWGAFAGYARAARRSGFAAGMMGLVYYDRWLKSKRATPLVGPGAAAVDEFEHRSWFESLTPGRRLALLIATGHRPAQLRRGARDRPVGGRRRDSPRARPDHRLRRCTTRPRASASSGRCPARRSGRAGASSALMGLIGGGPTFVGTVIGQAWVSPALEVAFFAVAGGSILYVVIQLLEVCRRYAMPVLVGWMLLLGLLLGFATDWVLVAAGA